MTDKEAIIQQIKFLLPKCKYAVKKGDKGLLMYRFDTLILFVEELIGYESEVEE